MIWILIVALAVGLLLLAVMSQPKPRKKGRAASGRANRVGSLDREFVAGKWTTIQAMSQGNGGSLRDAVSEADKLVDDVLKHLADGFDRQRQDLEHQWSGGEPSTEDLRSALQRYRAFFQRLLTL